MIAECGMQNAEWIGEERRGSVQAFIPPSACNEPCEARISIQNPQSP